VNWNPLSFRSSRKPARPRPPRAARLDVERLESRLAPAVNVLTFHNDLASTGLNPNEIQLTPANVHVGSFGKLFTTAMDGQVYAQPLVDTGVTITNGPNTQPGAAGVHDVVYVATEHDSLFALDARGGAVLWQRSFLDLANANNNTLGATAIGAVPSADTGSTDLVPEVGITGTPVIDPNTALLYVVVKSKETIGGAAHYVQRLHAVNLADGTDAVAPYLIGDTTNDNANNTPIYVYGNGDGHVTDPYNGTGTEVVQFNALREHQRAALSLVNNTVYVAWASHGDNGPYHGWVAAWDVASLAGRGFQLKGVFNTSPSGGLAGIWQGGGRLAFEADGSAFYFETGNGAGGTGNPVADGNYYEALVKVVADPGTGPAHQNKNGWGLRAADYFVPFSWVALDNADEDFGSAAPLLLPDAAGIPGHPHLLVAAGKEGKIYLVDRDNLGQFDPNNDRVLNAIPDGSGHNTPPVLLGGALSTAAYWGGKIYWISGYSNAAIALVVNANGTLAITSQTAIQDFGFVPGSAVVSANGATNGIVWLMDRAANQIHAYDATTLATELWNSGQRPGGADAPGAVVKFAVPTVANAMVYVGTSTSLVAYGLGAEADSVPNSPTLSAAVLSASSVNLTWTDATAPPNTATGYRIEQSTDNVTFTQVTTAPVGATALAVGGLTPSTTYYFRIRGFNALGNSAYSNTASAVTTGGLQAPNAPSALGATPAAATAVTLTWTDNAGNQDGYHLDRATDADFTQGLTTQDLPATPATFTDTAAGLAPGGTYFYRLRAFNAAGASDNSNVAVVTIPLAPAKPTDAQVTSVTANAIALTWTDNAGRSATNYVILRKAGAGSFVTYATLPARNATPPSAYAWSDTGVSPGTAYEYHIEAVNISGHNDFAGANASALTAPPGALRATVQNGVVNLSWDAPAGALSYNVYRGTQAGGEGPTPIATGLTTSAYTDAAVTPRVAYFYVVTAVNANAGHVPALPGEGAPSNETSATVPLALLDGDLPVVPDSPPPAKLLDAAQALAHSREHYTQFVIQAYQQYLKRLPDGPGLDFWVGNMLAGVYSDERVESFFLGSQEYIANHGGTGPAWVTGMYQDLLGRTPSAAEVQGWVRALDGGTSADAVALGFAASPEREGQRVRFNYQTYLGRVPRPDEVDLWVNGFLAGLANEALVAGFVGSPEYYQNPQKAWGNKAAWVAWAYRDVLFRNARVSEVNGWLQFLG
jgi:fibronectin type 3 domain-containing protein